MTTVADQFEHVVGIDTHARTHTYCLVETRTGGIIDTATFPTTSAGTNRALSWIARRSQGTTTLAAIEGTSSYGAGIAAALAASGFEVTEIRPIARPSRARTGKSDPIDAEAAARSVIREDLDKLAQPRRTGDRTALRVLLAARALVDQQRTANRNALTALVRSIDLSVDARKPLTDAQIATIAAWRTNRDDATTRVFREEARRLARAVLEQTEVLRENHRQLEQLTEALAPGLQAVPGVGAVTGAILVAAYSHHGRVRSEAAFAALGGIAPLPASSGNTTRHRLSRSGDRQLNRAVDVVVRTRLSYDPTTREYASRRRAEGLSNREIRRCLKRYVCRALYRELRTRMT
ncbi:IS110 family transposase [Microbacterium sp. GbtcB4]|uniref:IS110 family transposase n=1 Tax=Microbacterium sp. GbtcB4 TaxID=2824749 RepID=UPI001C2FBC17